MSPVRQPNREDGGPRPRPIAEYVKILRYRWVSALVVFVLVSGAVAVRALLSTPAYSSSALIQIEKERSGTEILAELSLLEGPSNVDAELEIMRSFTVASRAATTSGAMAIVLEENAYRPWNALVRGLRDGPPVCRLQADLPPGSTPRRDGSYRLLFDASGTRVTIVDLETGETLGTQELPGAGEGTLVILEQELVLRVVAGSPLGRTFILRLRTLPAAAKWIREGVDAIEVGTRTGVIQLGFQAESPHLAQRIADAVSRGYLEHRQARKQEQLSKRIQWLEEEIAGVEAELESALDARDVYVAAEQAILLGDKARAIFEGNSALLAQRLAQEQAVVLQESNLEALRITKDPANVMAALGISGVDVQTRAMADRLAQLEIERGALLRQGVPSQGPEVKRLDAEILESQAALQERTEALRGEVAASIQRRIASIRHRIAQIEREEEKHQGQLDEIPEEQRALSGLKRQVDRHDRILSFLVRMHGEAMVAGKSAMTSAYQVDEARVPDRRSSPSLFRNGLVALVLGVLAGMGIALLRDARDSSIRTPLDIEERLGLPLYGAIPNFATLRRRERSALRGTLVTRDNPQSALAESYRGLRANVLFTGATSPVRTLTITSAVQGEGKTVTLLNLAIVMAEAGNSVVLVDADLRSPMIHRLLEGSRSPGLVDVMKGTTPWRQTLVQTPIPGLSYIPAGVRTEAAAPLFETDKFQMMLTELREEFEYVLFDVPPVLAGADAASLFRRQDAVLLVCREGACPGSVVENAREQVERLGANLVGAILNAFDARRANRQNPGKYGYAAYRERYGHDYEDSEPTGGGLRGARRGDESEEANRPG